MPLAPGTRFGPYEIVSPLGAGGMGEVYRAKDTRLGREVAVKVLPMHLSANPEVRARFEREAKTISSLNHPNICVLFDVGREADTDFIVMELVEGDTLAERLRRGPLSPAELLRFGTQIADALDRAHRAGVIHRDLKPANIMITRSGAKLMDFGLSRATGLAAGAGGTGTAALTQSPTMAQALTAEGTLLGTFQYMSPEQLEGRDADARSDIWALGCVLYEMATGRRAFEGRSQASLIAAILEREPPAVGEAPSGSATVAAPPHGIERLIRNCLAKDPDERIQTAHDVRLQMQGIAEVAGLSSTSVAASASVVAASAVAHRRSRGAPLPWVLAAAGLIAAIGVFAWLYPRANMPPAAIRFRVNDIPGVTEMFWPRISPDGKYLVIDADDSSGVTRAYLRPMDQLEAHPIPGTENLQRAYWSPDSREIAFVADAKVQRVPIGGGSPVVVCAAPGGADLSWGSRGFILTDGRFSDSLKIVPAGGGELRPATRIDRAANERGSAWPCFLPDGRHFLFIGNRTDGAGNIRLGTVGTLDSKVLGRSDGRAEYAPGGWVLFLKGTTLVAQKLDLRAARLTGQPIPIVEGIRTGNSQGHFSISRTGVLAVSKGMEGDDLRLREASRAGAEQGPTLASGNIGNPRLSPDGRRLLYMRSASAIGMGSDIYVLDLARGTDTRLTLTDDNARTAVWAPDGRRFAYTSLGSNGAARLRVASADGLGAQDSIVLPSRGAVSLTQWSAVGPRLVYYSNEFKAYAVPIEGAARVPQALIDTTEFMGQTEISPDGRWLAGVMGDLPGVHVFVQSLSGPAGRWQISTLPAFNPRWTKGGRELIWESTDGRLMAASIDTDSGFHAGTPTPLFQLPRPSIAVDVTSWTCDSDGKRFFVLTAQRNRTPGVIEVVTNFHGLVSRK